MERESFEDSEVATILNKNFISIKVDREERPDVDAVYMHVLQILTGNGGWPMSIFMDQEKRPFYAGTYFPKNDGVYGLGFITLLEKIIEMWHTDKQRLITASQQIISELTEQNRNKTLDYKKVIKKGCQQLAENSDPQYGGFGNAPKFPSPHNLILLLRYYHTSKDRNILEIAERALIAMYRGGIRDHLGFGFCRYSTDKRWLVPHFEKMLYDNALLAMAYSEAFLLTKKHLYKRSAEEIFEYIKRDMTSPEGAFFSAEDADSQGLEGKFYTFTKNEVLSILGNKDGEKFCNAYDISIKGNFEGRNILNLIENDNYEEVIQNVFYTNSLHKLFACRNNRIRPLRDDKILTAWNGLMIYALAYAGKAFGNIEYIKMAEKAADFILEKMLDDSGRLLTRYRDGEARFSGVAEDYAFAVMGLIELYQASFKAKYLSEAYRLNKILIADFFENGALYQTGKNSEVLISRPRELYDGALPSYNSTSVNNFVKLSHLCGDPDLISKADEIIHFFGADIEKSPAHFSFGLCGMMLHESRQIIITGDYNVEIMEAINHSYQPFSTIAFVDSELSQNISFYKDYNSKDGEPVVYICEGSHCEQPIFDLKELHKKLEVI